MSRRIGRRIDIHRRVDSTNGTAFDALAAGAPDGTVIVADAQRSGRGRQGRTWHSPPGKNLYLSILLTEGLTRERMGALPFLVAVILRDTITAATALHAGVKWPNDLTIGGRKVAGLLIETRMTGTEPVAAVIGIGLNVNWRRRMMPAAIRSTATSLQDETGRRIRRPRLLAILLDRLDRALADLERDGAAPQLEAWRRACVTLGQHVAVDTVSGRRRGVAEGVDAAGRLLVRLPEGTIHPVSIEETLHLEADGQPAARERSYALRH